MASCATAICCDRSSRPRSEHVKRAAERITARVAHQGQQAVRALPEVHRLAGQIDFHAGRHHVERTARRIRRSAASLTSGPTRIITSPTTISTARGGEHVEVSALCFSKKVFRQPNSCGGEIPRRRGSAETFTPGSSAAATACALNSSDYRRRSPTGAPSKGPITASTNCKLPVAGIGVELVVDMEPRRQTNAGHLTQNGVRAKPRGPLAAYRADGEDA